MKLCEWGECDAPATAIVRYPAVLPGTAGRERSWLMAEPTMYLNCCDACAAVTSAEADQMEAWRYEIQARDHEGQEWSASGLGWPNQFRTETDAETAIEELRALGGEWTAMESGVRGRAIRGRPND